MSIQQGAEWARPAIEAFEQAAGMQGGKETQVWHLLLCLMDYCEAEGLDFDHLLANVREERPVIHGRA